MAHQQYRNPDGAWVDVPRPLPLKQVVHDALCNALAYTNGSAEQAAKLLGLHKRTMFHQMKSHGVPVCEPQRAKPRVVHS